jgi:hypothetical protein
MDFDADRIYYSHQNLHGNVPVAEGSAAPDGRGPAIDEDERAVDADALRRHYREFLSEFSSCRPFVPSIF